MVSVQLAVHVCPSILTPWPPFDTAAMFVKITALCGKSMSLKKIPSPRHESTRTFSSDSKSCVMRTHATGAPAAAEKEEGEEKGVVVGDDGDSVVVP